MNPSLLVAFALSSVVQRSANAVRDIPFKQIESAGFSRQRDPKVFVMHSAKDYQTYNVTCGREMPTPDIDWRKHELIAIHIGSAPSTGYEVSVKRVVKAKHGGVVVEVLESTPPPGTMQAMHVTYPYVIVKTAKFNGTVTMKLLKSS